MKKIFLFLSLFSALLIVGCFGKKEKADIKKPERSVVVRKAPVRQPKKTSLSVSSPGLAPKKITVCEDSLGAITNLCYNPKYYDLIGRSCFATSLLQERIKKDDRADWHFALAFANPEGSKGREAELLKALELDNAAPFPLLELFICYGEAGELERGEALSENVGALFAIPSFRKPILERVLQSFRTYYWRNSVPGLLACSLAPYDNSYASSLAADFLRNGQINLITKILPYARLAKTSAEKEAWLEILAAVDSSEAIKLKNEIDFQGERSAASLACQELYAVEKGCYEGLVNWDSQKLQDARLKVLQNCTNEALRCRVAEEFLYSALNGFHQDDPRVKDYVAELEKPKGSRVKEFQIYLNVLKQEDRSLEARTFAERALALSDSKERAKVLSAMLRADVDLEKGTIEEVLAENPTNIKLLQELSSYCEMRGQIEEAVVWQKKLLGLMKTPKEKNAVLANVARLLGKGEIKGQLTDLIVDSQDDLLQEGDFDGLLTYYKLLLTRGDTNSVFKTVAEMFLEENEDAAKREALLAFLLGPNWQAVAGVNGLAVEIAKKVQTGPTTPKFLRSLETLTYKLIEIREYKSALEVIGCLLRNGVPFSGYVDLSEAFHGQEEAKTYLLTWVEEANISPAQLSNFITPLLWNYGDGAFALDLCEKLWQKEMATAGAFSMQLFYYYSNRLRVPDLSEKVREHHLHVILESCIECVRSGAGNVRDILAALTYNIWQLASDDDRKEIAHLVIDGLDSANIQEYALMDLCRRIRTLNDEELNAKIDALMMERFSEEKLAANPKLFNSFFEYCKLSGKKVNQKEFFQQYLLSCTNLNAIVLDNRELLWQMEGLGLSEEAEKIKRELLDDPATPIYSKLDFLNVIKNQAERLQKLAEINESLEPGNAKNEIAFRLLQDCRGEENEALFRSALEYLEGSDQDYIWQRLINTTRDSGYKIDMENLFSEYEKAFRGKKPNDDLERTLSEQKLNYYRAEGNYKEALEAAQKLVELRPDKDQAYQDLASLYVNAGRKEDAVKTYEELLARFNEAMADGDTSKREWGRTAILGLLEMAGYGLVKLDPETVEKVILGDKPNLADYRSFFNLSEGLLPYEKQSEYFKKALELAADKNSSSEILSEWSNAALQNGDTNGCLAVMKQRLEFDQYSVAEYIDLLEKTGESKEALQAGLEAWEKLSGNKQDYRRVALGSKLFNLALKNDDKDAAWEVLQTSWSKDLPDHMLRVSEALGNAKKIGREEEALKGMLERLEATEEGYVKINGVNQLCWEMKRLGKNDEAKELADKILESYDSASNSSLGPQLISVAFESSHPEKGLEMIRENFNDGNSYLLNTAMNYFDQKNDREGKLDFLKSLPESFEKNSSLADVYLKSGDENERKEAVRLMQEAVQSGECNEYEIENAREKLLQAATKGNGDPYLLADLANQYAADTHLSDSDRQSKLVNLYESAKDFDKASSAYQNWLLQEKNPFERAIIKERYANFLAQSGKTEEAVNTYQEILSSNISDEYRKEQVRGALINLYTKGGDKIKADNLRRERISNLEQQLVTFQYGSRAKELRAQIEAEKKALNN